MKHHFLTLLTLLFFPLAAYSVEPVAPMPEPAGKSPALPFVAYVRDPVGSAMGSCSFASSLRPAFAAFSNPASVPFSSKKVDCALSYSLWQPSTTHYMNLGASFKFKERFAFVAGVSLGINSGLSDVGLPLDVLASAGFGWRFVPNFSAGVNLRYAGQSLTKGSILSALLADVVLMGNVSDFSAVLGVVNVGTGASYGFDFENSYKVPSGAVLSLDYSPTFGAHALSLAFDFKYYFAFGPNVSAGAAYCWNELLSLRAGYFYGGTVFASCPTLGLGLSFYGFSIDAAYCAGAKSNPLANTFTIAAAYSF